MTNITICDATLCYMKEQGSSLTFKEKLEIAKLLDRLSVPVIALGSLDNVKADSLLVKTIAGTVNNSVLSVETGLTKEGAENAWEALKGAKAPRLLVSAPVSPARMEYVSHLKQDAVLKRVSEIVRFCREKTDNVEFLAEDATRADFGFLCRIIGAAIENGASVVTVCDTAGTMLPGEFGEFLKKLSQEVPALSGVRLSAGCSDGLNLADALAVEAILSGAEELRVSSLKADAISLSGIVGILAAKADVLQARTDVLTTELHRVLSSMERLVNGEKSAKSPFEDGVRKLPSDAVFTAKDSIEDLMLEAEKLGYDLSEEDQMKVWRAFRKTAERKDSVTVPELEAIIASEAMQVPAAYTLEEYLVNTGNTIDVTAHVKLKYHDTLLDGLSIGDGSIDAAFLAIEKLTGNHYELDDFQIRSVTEGREAMGETIVKLRSGGKVYSGRGLSTDIIASGIAAYVSALNKIVYEEENG